MESINAGNMLDAVDRLCPDDIAFLIGIGRPFPYSPSFCIGLEDEPVTRSFETRAQSAIRSAVLTWAAFELILGDSIGLVMNRE